MKEITIDIDISYKYYIYSFYFQTMRNKIEVVNEFHHHIIERYIRESSSGRTHIKLVFQEELSILEGFLIRAFLKDDPYRLSLDMSRYFMTNDTEQINRCFDTKWKDGELLSSGEWYEFTRWGY